jgi:hypothetical protein
LTIQRTRTLFESATQRARIIRHLDIVCFIVDGGGAMIVPTADFVQTQKWAAARIASGNPINDRGRLIERWLVLVSRPGSIAQTRGNPRQLQAIARSMLAAGYDLGEWALPQEIKNPPRPIDQMGARKPKSADAPDEADDAGAPDDSTPDQ